MAIINESAARIAKELSSFSDYVEGSATASYNAQCAEAAAILEQVKPKCATADQRERAEWLYNRYCTVLAEAINRKNEIGTRCPSVLICGPANFPVRKKEKQVAAWDANLENFRKAEHYLQMLKRAHTFAVKSDDPEVLNFLHAKLDQLQAAHQTMKDANAYYRKYKTLDGCPGVTATLSPAAPRFRSMAVHTRPMLCKTATRPSNAPLNGSRSWKRSRLPSPSRMTATATPTGRTSKQCVSSLFSMASPTMRLELF